MVMSQVYSDMKANLSQAPLPASLKSFQTVENAVPVSPSAYISYLLLLLPPSYGCLLCMFFSVVNTEMHVV